MTVMFDRYSIRFSKSNKIRRHSRLHSTRATAAAAVATVASAATTVAVSLCLVSFEELVQLVSDGQNGLAATTTTSTIAAAAAATADVLQRRLCGSSRRRSYRPRCRRTGIGARKGVELQTES